MSTSTKRWYPGPFEGMGDIDKSQLDTALKTIFQHSYALEQSFASGSLKVKGHVKAVASGLNTLSDIVVSIDSGSAPSNQWVTATPSATPGAFDVYVWQPTSAGSTVPIASTVATLVRWHAKGA